MSIIEGFKLDGKVAVVTGGARGIGAASAKALAEAGAKVAIIDIIDTASIINELVACGNDAKGYKADLTNETQVDEVIGKIKKDFGRIDILHNNAGIAHCVKSEEMTFAEWRKVMDIDLDAVFLVARAVGRIMISDGNGGSIINTASMSGIIVNYPQEQVAYNAAKAGVIHLTKSLACEWIKHGIRVNCVSPGYICTDMTPGNSNKAWMDIWFQMSPTKRLGMPDEVAGAVLYLASSASSFTNGCNIVIDGGYSCY